MEIQRDFGNSHSFACYMRMLDAMGLIFYDLRVLTCATVSQSMSPIALIFCLVPTEKVPLLKYIEFNCISMYFRRGTFSVGTKQKSRASGLILCETVAHGSTRRS